MEDKARGAEGADDLGADEAAEVQGLRTVTCHGEVDVEVRIPTAERILLTFVDEPAAPPLDVTSAAALLVVAAAAGAGPGEGATSPFAQLTVPDAATARVGTAELSHTELVALLAEGVREILAAELTAALG